MTLEEAIKHAEEVADSHDRIKQIKAVTLGECKCAAEHRQLAEWLQELKKYKQLYEDKWFETHSWLKHNKDAIPKEIIFKDVTEDTVSRNTIVKHFDDLIKASALYGEYNQGFVDSLEFCKGFVKDMKGMYD